ncbi:MAG: epoxyqueuosine reductase QueH [Neisseria elongata]
MTVYEELKARGLIAQVTNEEEISKREHFYQQEYCGCAYSLRDSNAHRKSQGRIPIKLGVLYYGDESTQYENVQPAKIKTDE